LRGAAGDAINALLSAAAMNFGKLLSFFLAFLLSLLNRLPPAARKIQIA
jgi:IS5 family transposase